MPLNPDQSLATREESAPIQRRTRKRSTAKLGLDASGVKVQKLSKKVQPSEVAANRVRTEVAEIATAYVDEWNQQAPVLNQFMEEVFAEVGASLLGVPTEVNESGISLTFGSEAE